MPMHAVRRFAFEADCWASCVSSCMQLKRVFRQVGVPDCWVSPHVPVKSVHHCTPTPVFSPLEQPHMKDPAQRVWRSIPVPGAPRRLTGTS